MGIGHAGGRSLDQLAAELLAIFRNALDRETLHQVREGALHQMPVLDHVGDAGRRARVVLQHIEIALGIADDVGAGDVDIGAARRIVAHHFRPEVRVSEHEVRGQDAVLQDLALVIDVPEEKIERLDPLLDAAVELAPVAGGDHARDDIEG